LTGRKNRGLRKGGEYQKKKKRARGGEGELAYGQGEEQGRGAVTQPKKRKKRGLKETRNGKTTSRRGQKKKKGKKNLREGLGNPEEEGGPWRATAIFLTKKVVSKTSQRMSLSKASFQRKGEEHNVTRSFAGLRDLKKKTEKGRNRRVGGNQRTETEAH